MATTGGAGPVAARTQALAILDGIITQQASVLAFEHAFRIVAMIALLVLVCVPFLRKPTSQAAH